MYKFEWWKQNIYILYHGVFLCISTHWKWEVHISNNDCTPFFCWVSIAKPSSQNSGQPCMRSTKGLVGSPSSAILMRMPLAWTIRCRDVAMLTTNVWHGAGGGVRFGYLVYVANGEKWDNNHQQPMCWYALIVWFLSTLWFLKMMAEGNMIEKHLQWDAGKHWQLMTVGSWTTGLLRNDLFRGATLRIAPNFSFDFLTYGHCVTEVAADEL